VQANWLFGKLKYKHLRTTHHFYLNARRNDEPVVVDFLGLLVALFNYFLERLLDFLFVAHLDNGECTMMSVAIEPFESL
jgi:hypothetical protein